METEKIIEPPGQGTPGLTSATQIVNTTSFITFSENTTCATNTHMLAIFPLEMNEKGPLKSIFPPLISRKEKFIEALKASMQKNRQILKELSKY